MLIATYAKDMSKIKTFTSLILALRTIMTQCMSMILIHAIRSTHVGLVSVGLVVVCVVVVRLVGSAACVGLIGMIRR